MDFFLAKQVFVKKSKWQAILVGYGKMGNHHLRVLSENSRVDVCAIIDPLQSHSQIASYVDLHSFFEQSLKNGFPKADLAVVTAPAEVHALLGLHLLQEGLHVLMEKPLANSVSEAQALIQKAEEGNLVLSVGHSERYNPAFQMLCREIRKGSIGQIIQIQAVRMNPQPQHSIQLGVTMDLAIHDLDCITLLMDGLCPDHISAELKHRDSDLFEDEVNADLCYSNGVQAQIQAAWSQAARKRCMTVRGTQGGLVCDFLHQEVFRIPHDSSDDDILSEKNRDELLVLPGDCLTLEQHFFLQQIEKKESDLLGNQSALLAIQIAQELVKSAEIVY